MITFWILSLTFLRSAFAFAPVGSAKRQDRREPVSSGPAAADEQPSQRRKRALIVLLVLTFVLSATIGCVTLLAIQGRSADATMLCQTAIPTELGMIGTTLLFVLL